MKKKIKDLTLKEFDKFCDKQHEDCVGCPLSNIEFGDGEVGCDLLTYIYDRDGLNKRYGKYPLDLEIEVEE